MAGAGENQATGNLSGCSEIDVNEYNGLLLKVDKPIESRIVMGQRLTCAPQDPDCAFADPDFSQFAELLVRDKVA